MSALTLKTARREILPHGRQRVGRVRRASADRVREKSLALQNRSSRRPVHMNGRVYDYTLGRFLSVDPIIGNPLSSQSLNPYSYIGNNPLSGTDPTGYECQGDSNGKFESACLMSNDGVNKLLSASGKTIGTAIVLNKGDTVSSNLSNGGSFSATFTGKTGDISRVLNGSAPSDIGSISKTTNGTLDGTAASYAFGQDKSAAHVTDVMAQQQRAQQMAGAEAYRQYTFAHEGLEGVPILGVEAFGQAAYGAYNEARQNGGVSAATIGGVAAMAAAGVLHVPGAAAAKPALREAYENEVRGLADIGLNSQAAGATEEATARMLHQMRRDLGVKYKGLTPPEKLDEIHARNMGRYNGDKLGPSVEWLRDKGKTWQQIIESASRPGGQDLGF